MTILTVDDDPDRLWELVNILRHVFYDATVEYTHDPLMAGRFGSNNPVDILFTALDMKRMDGLQLKNFLRRTNPDIQVYFIAHNHEFRTDVIDKGGGGRILYPVKKEMLKNIKADLKGRLRASDNKVSKINT